MALLPITPVPGIVTNGTPYSKKGRWTDGDLVRFQNGNLKPIGGWEKLKSTALTGTPTALYAYSDNAGNSILAVGTRQKVYVLTRNIWYDITPTRASGTGNITGWSTVDTTPTVTVTDASHGAIEGDFVTITSVSGAVNGIPAATLF